MKSNMTGNHQRYDYDHNPSSGKSNHDSVVERLISSHFLFE